MTKQQLREAIRRIIKQELNENKHKVGDIVTPNKGPHKGQKHKVIHVNDDGTYNIQPIGLKTKDIKYKLGATKAKPEDLNEAPLPGVMDPDTEEDVETDPLIKPNEEDDDDLSPGKRTVPIPAKAKTTDAERAIIKKIANRFISLNEKYKK